MASSATLRVFRWTSDVAEGLAFRYACRVGMCGSCAHRLRNVRLGVHDGRAQRVSLSPADSIRPLRRLAVFRLFGLSR
jgi:succinate dehydrogenase/fumarate reductase-like Fe-S protein